jgi:CysZ protein
MQTGRSGRGNPRSAGTGRESLSGGARLLCDGFRLLASERRLWALSAVPVGFSLIALAIAGAVVITHAAAIAGFIDALWPIFEVTHWYAWLWVGPARALFFVLSLVVFVAFVGLVAVIAVMVATLVAAPFLDELAHRVEQLVAPGALANAQSGVAAFARDVGRSIAGEARRLFFLLGIWAVLFGAGIVVPGAHVITGPLMIGVTILFLPLEFAGYALDRRHVSFTARRRWIARRWPTMIGFGTAALIACAVPGVNLVMIPGLVVAGTLLVVSDPPEDG